ncbi:multidrug effflux MFS transporter [Cellulomonas marina]|uniref:MFS transporter, DHA1 family, bicyclomycin/chloramphenicol resistance protein n=1 Tax=Cellulomonas marina TaxID=988821 RepID=A0A1I1ATY1_9CELL|nr:multidrug effflux MFS transporter [Cellulomonas marina]GIG30273.1 Bcr/CflA family drug resistance efflux transporter [Cellulomonas marina]SFB40876.1 MFS transporter, DHA1 family, bicyclomycin/chloramphenicol resistance protein [Cellulomonas marina]
MSPEPAPAVPVRVDAAERVPDSSAGPADTTEHTARRTAQHTVETAVEHVPDSPAALAADVPSDVVRDPSDDGTAVTGTPPAPPVSARSGKASVGDVVLLGSMCALPAMATDLYLPSLPDVARELGTSVAGAQLTMTGMLIGGAMGQLVMGPLSDRFGRRRPVLVGIAGHVLTSLLCTVVPSIGVLVALRVSQGFLAAAATVGAIAVIRDRWVGAEASRMMSRLMLVIGAAPLLAPSLGGGIASQVGWRGVFGALAVMGVALAIFVHLRLEETLPPERRRQGGVGTALHGYGQLLHDRGFVALAVLPGLGMAVLMSYVISSPFVLQEQYGLSSQAFALVFALNGIGLVLGAQANAAIVTRVGPLGVLRVAPVVTLVLSGALLALALTGAGGLVPLLVVLFCILTAANFTPPNASALALSRHGEVAGSGAAVVGCFQAGVAGVVSPLTGVLGGDAVAMAAVMLGAAALCLTVLVVATPAYRRRSADPAVADAVAGVGGH